jgi:hypothetical protein
MSSIEAALAAIKLQNPGENICYTKIAQDYGINRSTISGRPHSQTALQTASAEECQNLHPQQEQQLLRYIEQLTERGLPPTQALIQCFGSEITKNELGIHWVDQHIKCYEIHLISCWATGINRSRHQAESQSKYSLYFELLCSKISQYNIEPCHMYNMDEKGFMLGILTCLKQVFSRRMYKEGKIKAHIQDGNQEWIMLLVCICADGSALDPVIIYQSASGLLQYSWLQAFNPDNHRTFFSASSSGWTNNNIGLAWLKHMFDCSKKAKAQSSYQLLFLNGHGSHLTMNFIEYCNQNWILLMVYPPHSNHTLQPLDVAMFKPLSSAYSGQVVAFMERCQGLPSMSKREFYPMFVTAWEASVQGGDSPQGFPGDRPAAFRPRGDTQEIQY